MTTEEQIIQLKADIVAIENVQGELKTRLEIYFGIENTKDAIELKVIDKLADYKEFADNYFHIPIPSFNCWYFAVFR